MAPALTAAMKLAPSSWSPPLSPAAHAAFEDSGKMCDTFYPQAYGCGLSGDYVEAKHFDRTNYIYQPNPADGDAAPNGKLLVFLSGSGGEPGDYREFLK